MMSKKKKVSKKLSPLVNWFGTDSLNSKYTSDCAQMLSQKFSGQLNKYTNVVKGWQFRWFVVHPQTGILDYYLNENEQDGNPRGSLYLRGAIICPSEEDSNTFSVNSTNGKSFELRAVDARSRQEWINRLRSVAEYHNTNVIRTIPLRDDHDVVVHSGVFVHGDHIHSPATCESFSAAKNHLFDAEHKGSKLNSIIEDFPIQGSTLSSINPDLLILKACSQSVISCLHECVSILQQTFAADCGFKQFSHAINRSTSTVSTRKGH